MNAASLTQMLVFAAGLTACGFALGAWLARVFSDRRGGMVDVLFARVAAQSRGTLRTDSPTFVTLLLAVIVITSGLTLLPSLVLGPVVEGLGP